MSTSSSNTRDQDNLDMERLAAGQDTALNDLMERHAEHVYRYLVRALQNEEDAADLAQEVFVRVYQNRKKFEQRSSFSSWAYAIANNLVRDRFRWRMRHPQVSLETGTANPESRLEDVLPAPNPSPSEEAQSVERTRAIRRAVAGLPKQLRIPLILAVYEDKSYARIGEILRCSAKAVEVRIYRARQCLRASLSDWLKFE